MSNNIRKQFPGIAKVDTIIDIAFTIGYITLIGAILLYSVMGWLALLLPRRLTKDMVHGVVAIPITVVLVVMTVTPFAMYCFGDVQDDKLIDATLTMLQYDVVVIVGGIICYTIANLFGKD